MNKRTFLLTLVFAIAFPIFGAPSEMEECPSLQAVKEAQGEIEERMAKDVREYTLRQINDFTYAQRILEYLNHTQTTAEYYYILQKASRYYALAGEGEKALCCVRKIENLFWNFESENLVLNILSCMVQKVNSRNAESQLQILIQCYQRFLRENRFSGCDRIEKIIKGAGQYENQISYPVFQELKTKRGTALQRRHFLAKNGRQIVLKGSTTINLCYIPEGTENITLNQKNNDVLISRPFMISKTPISAEQWCMIMTSRHNPSTQIQASISRLELNEFCKKLTEHYVDEVPEGYVFRLPTQAEIFYILEKNKKNAGFSPWRLQPPSDEKIHKVVCEDYSPLSNQNYFSSRKDPYMWLPTHLTSAIYFKDAGTSQQLISYSSWDQCAYIVLGPNLNREARLRHFLPRRTWQVVKASSTRNDRNPLYAFDGDYRTEWTSAPNAINEINSITVDMQKTETFSKFDLLPTVSRSSRMSFLPLSYKFYISNDNQHWDLISEGKLKYMSMFHREEQVVDFGKEISARYFKLEMPNGIQYNRSQIEGVSIKEFYLIR